MKKIQMSVGHGKFIQACSRRGINTPYEVEKTCDDIIACMPDKAKDMYEDAYEAALANLDLFLGDSNPQVEYIDPLTPVIREDIQRICGKYGIPEGEFTDEICGVISEFLEGKILEPVNDSEVARRYLKLYLDNADDVFNRILSTLTYTEDKSTVHYAEFVEQCGAFDITTDTARDSLLIRILVYAYPYLKDKSHPDKYETALKYFDSYTRFMMNPTGK